MTTPSSPSPAWTPREQTEYLATRIMGWKREKVDAWIDPSGKYGENFNGYRSVIMNYQFKPLTDWNHFRWLEEKVMEDIRLFEDYMEMLSDHTEDFWGSRSLIRSNLPARVSALIAAHQSLSPSPL